MDKELDSTGASRKISPPQWPHLKPLSVNSRIVSCDQKTSPQLPEKFSNPFINLKIEVLNNGTSKRKRDDSSADDGYTTPAKKAFTPKTVSPDLGCFMDYCSPLTRQESESPVSPSNPAFLQKTQGIRGDIKESVNPQLHPKHVEHGSSTDPGDEGKIVSSSFQDEGVLLNLGPTFDCDADILSLNPFDTSNAAGFSDNVESCRNPRCNMQNVAHRQVEERGDGQVQEGREELKKDMCLNVKDLEGDKGYFSVSSFSDHKIGATPPDSLHSQLPPSASSPQLRTAEAELSHYKFHPENSSEPQCDEQAAKSGYSIVEVLCPSVSEPLLEPMNLPVGCFQGTEEMLDIGPPIFESSVCEGVTVNLDATREKSGPGSEETKEDVTDSVHDCQDTTCDSSFSNTLPLQVQVKSKVVIPTTSTKPFAPLLPGQNTKLTNEDRTVQTTRHEMSQRTVIFNREVDWKHKKNLYINSVTHHMNENPGANHGVMSELQSLMIHVANQVTSFKGTQWQHPSDITCRNYQRRFGNAAPRMSLHEWMTKNCPTQKRFDKVPNIFERTPFP